MFYRVQKGVKKGAPAGSVSGCGGGCGFPQPFCRTRTGVAVSRRYWGFDSGLALLLLTFQHRAGVSPYTSSFDLAETCVFDKQLPGPIHCGSYCYEHPFSRSYGVNLPSSLTTLLPLALEFSSYLPVSVCGTGAADIH